MTIGTTPGAIPTATSTPPAATSSSSGAVTSPLSVFPKEFNMYKGEHYHFFCGSDSGGLVPTLYQNVLSQASQEVWVWDPYFHQVDGAIFGSITKPNVKIKIITEPKVPLIDFKDGVVSNMETSMSASVKVGCTLTITQAKGMGFSNWKMHDRFLIVDKAQVYLIGSSVGNYLSLAESTGAFEVVDSNDKDLIIKAFEYYWVQLDKSGNVAFHSL